MTGEAGARGPVRFESPSGLAVMVNRNGSLRRIEHRDVVASGVSMGLCRRPARVRALSRICCHGNKR
jgi:hypothetical protein